MRLGSLIFLVALCGVLYYGYTQYKETQDLIDKGTKTSGFVVENLQAWGEDDGYYYYPTIEFTSKGKKYQFEGPYGSEEPEYKIKEKVKVIYPKDHPEKAQVDDFWVLWLDKIIMAAAVLLPLLGGGIIAIFTTKNENTPLRS